MKGLRPAATLFVSTMATVWVGQGVALAQTPGSLAAGEYRNTSNEAGFFTFGGSANFSLDVFDSVHDSAPKGAPSTSTHTTELFVNAFGPTVFGNGCYDINASDFTFGSGAASLHTTVTEANACAGPPGSLPLPLTVDATWTGNAPTTASRRESLLDCGAFSMEEMLTSQIQGASATVTLTPLFSDTFSAPQFQLLRSDSEVIHVQGVQPDGCGGAPGIPGGAGPPPAGDYQSSMTLAGASFFDPTTGGFAFFGITDSTQLSSPRGGVTTTTSEFDIHFNIFGAGTFAFGCYELIPANFSNSGVVSATLNLTIDQNTPVCPGAVPNIPLPETLSINWSGIAPIATQRDISDFNCLTYRLEGTSLATTSRASATATLSPMFGTPFTTPDQGSLITTNSAQHAEGAQQPVCHL